MSLWFEITEYIAFHVLIQFNVISFVFRLILVNNHLKSFLMK